MYADKRRESPAPGVKSSMLLLATSQSKGDMPESVNVCAYVVDVEYNE
jgi:hypothetical protein